VSAGEPGAPPPCPLCQGEGSARLDEVRGEDLERLYVALAGEPVRPELAPARGRRLGLWRCPGCDLRFFSPALVGGAGLYAALQRLPWYYLDDKREYRFAAEQVPKGARLLEVGCGTARFARLVPQARYLGLELNGEAAATARASGLDVRVESLAAHAAAHPGAYDAVAAFQVLEHLASPRDFLREARAALAAGGRLLVSVPAEDSYLGRGQNYALNLPPHHQTRWTLAALRSVARLFGFRLLALEHEPLADLHAADYAFTRCDAALTLGRRRLVDLSRRARARRLLAALAARGLAPLVLRARRRPPGHSLTVVYERT